MRLMSRRSDGSLHREWLQVIPVAGEPWTFYIPSGGLVREQNHSTWSSPFPVIAFFFPQEFYQIFMLLKETGTEYYCNVISPAQFIPSSDVIEFVDLDLDVIKAGESVRAVDEDEFEVKKAAYSTDWVENAKKAMDRLLSMATEETGPFTPATADWWRAWCHNCKEQ